ncbi:hypothetical protein JYT87_01030 [Nitrospira defluvii]|nr:hypothetical protein [Nitrospira defluvii]
MGKIIQKKTFPILVLAIFYFSYILLGALSTSATSEHIRHQRGTRHSLTCLSACSSVVAQIATPPILPSSLPFLGILLVIASFLFYQTNTSILRSRAPPPVSI